MRVVNTLTTMTINPWINRFAVVTIIFMMYAVGISVGRDQMMQQPACHRVN
jgi:hypothetical protein